MAENNGVKSRRDQQLERLRKKYPDKKFEDDEEIYGQISDDYDQYEHDLDGYKGREKAMSDMFAADPRSAQFLADMHNGQDPVLGLVKNFGVDIKDVLDDPEMQDKIAEANKEYVERVAKSKQLDEEYEKNMDATLETLRQFQEERGMTDEQIDEVANAGEEGRVAGRNDKIVEGLRKRDKGDGTAPLNGKNGGAPSQQKQSQSIFDLANEAM